MKLQFKFLLLLLLFSCLEIESAKCQDQEENGGIEKIQSITLKNSFFNKLFNNTEFSLYMNPDATRIIANSTSKFYIIDTKSGDIILDLKIKAHALNGRANDFIVLEDQNIVLIPDKGDARTFRENEKGTLHAYDLNTGKLLWRNEDLYYNFLFANVPREISLQYQNFTEYVSRLTDVKDIYYKTYEFYSSIRYVPEKNGLLIFDYEYGQRNKAYFLDIASGEVKWIYDDKKLQPIEHHYYPERDELVLINFTHKSKGDLVVINAENGEIVHELEYFGPYGKGGVNFHGDNLITTFRAVEIFDLDKGERIALSGNEEGIDFLNNIRDDEVGMGIPPYTIVKEPFVYTQVGDMMKNYKVPGSYGQNRELLRYNMSGGEKEVIKEDFKPTHQFVEIVDDKIIAFGTKFLKSTIYAYDLSNGEQIWESDGIKGFTGLNDKIVVRSDKIYVGSDKEIFVLNTKTGETIDETDLKDLKLGNLELLDKVGENILALGKRGLSFVGEAGDIKGSQKVQQNIDGLFDLVFPSEEILRAYWNDNYTFLFEESHLTAYDNQNMSLLGRIEYHDDYRMSIDEEYESYEWKNEFPQHMMYLSDNGEYFLKLERSNLSQNYTIDIFQFN